MEAKVLKSVSAKLVGIFIICFTMCFVFAKVEKIKNMEYRTLQTADFTRTVGTGYRASLTRDVVVQGSVSIASTLTLGGGQSGTINLQTSPDGVTYTTKQHCTNNNLGTLIVGINTNSVQDTELSTVIPKGWYYKFTSSGTSTMSTTVPVTETHF